VNTGGVLRTVNQDSLSINDVHNGSQLSQIRAVSDDNDSTNLDELCERL
jgi:hypothetical protein